MCVELTILGWTDQDLPVENPYIISRAVSWWAKRAGTPGANHKEVSKSSPEWFNNTDKQYNVFKDISIAIKLLNNKLLENKFFNALSWPLYHNGKTLTIWYYIIHKKHCFFRIIFWTDNTPTVSLKICSIWILKLNLFQFTIIFPLLPDHSSYCRDNAIGSMFTVIFSLRLRMSSKI